ncbi:hypothetical protein OJAV_G00085570 [Oryzias javanicus]|uniref:Peptidase M12B propeptide domain-containing protein n=1 Tax=Oryzias javanicus TaxID=123683 RepID=A0A437CYU6_ORYJA|nr:hypothetical protein OJAV_G00085570 [Oryzias javanicus]
MSPYEWEGCSSCQDFGEPGCERLTVQLCPAEWGGPGNFSEALRSEETCPLLPEGLRTSTGPPPDLHRSRSRRCVMALPPPALLLVGFVLVSADGALTGGREDQLRSRLKEYGLITPFSTDAHGHFLSHLLSAKHKQRVKREAAPPADSQQTLFFNITAFDKEFHLRLRPNTQLVAPGATVEWHDTVGGFPNASDAAGIYSGVGANQTEFGDGTERILRRELLKTDCNFIGDITDVPGASVAINNCDGLVSPPLAACGARSSRG